MSSRRFSAVAESCMSSEVTDSVIYSKYHGYVYFVNLNSDRAKRSIVSVNPELPLYDDAGWLHRLSWFQIPALLFWNNVKRQSTK